MSSVAAKPLSAPAPPLVDTAAREARGRPRRDVTHCWNTVTARTEHAYCSPVDRRRARCALSQRIALGPIAICWSGGPLLGIQIRFGCCSHMTLTCPPLDDATEPPLGARPLDLVISTSSRACVRCAASRLQRRH